VLRLPSPAATIAISACCVCHPRVRHLRRHLPSHRPQSWQHRGKQLEIREHCHRTRRQSCIGHHGDFHYQRSADTLKPGTCLPPDGQVFWYIKQKSLHCGGFFLSYGSVGSVVVLLLPANGGGWSVPAEHGHVGGQPKELVPDAVHLCLEVASWQVRSPDALLEQRVAAEQ